MDIFTAIYFVAIIIETAIRAPLNHKRQQEKLSKRRVTAPDNTLLGSLFLAMLAIPIHIAATDWLDFATCKLPAWATWLGASRSSQARSLSCGSPAQTLDSTGPVA